MYCDAGNVNGFSTAYCHAVSFRCGAFCQIITVDRRRSSDDPACSEVRPETGERFREASSRQLDVALSCSPKAAEGVTEVLPVVTAGITGSSGIGILLLMVEAQLLLLFL